MKTLFIIKLKNLLKKFLVKFFIEAKIALNIFITKVFKQLNLRKQKILKEL